MFSGQEKYHLDMQMTREGKSDKLVGKLGYPSFIGLVIFLLYLPLKTEIFSSHRWLLILWHFYIMQRLFSYNSHKLVLDQKVRE